MCAACPRGAVRVAQVEFFQQSLQSWLGLRLAAISFLLGASSTLYPVLQCALGFRVGANGKRQGQDLPRRHCNRAANYAEDWSPREGL